MIPTIPIRSRRLVYARGHLLRYNRQMDGLLPTVYQGPQCAQPSTSWRLGTFVGRHGPEALDVHTRLVVPLMPMGDSHRVRSLLICTKPPVNTWWRTAYRMSGRR